MVLFYRLHRNSDALGVCEKRTYQYAWSWYRENKNLEEAVVRHASSLLADGGMVEFVSKYLCEDYKENGEVRFSANVIYYVVSADGTKEKHTAHIVCNEDKDRIIEWKDITDK